MPWIHNEVLGGQPTRILDLGCGPGLYTQPAGAPRPRVRGHRLLAGVDRLCRASRRTTTTLHCTYVHDDIRAAEYGDEFGLVMLLFGEFNVFSLLDARAIVRKVSQALACDGMFLIEPHTLTARAELGPARRVVVLKPVPGSFPTSRISACRRTSGMSSAQAATVRYFVIDAASRQVTAYAQSLQAYSTEQYHDVLAQRGLEDIQYYPSLGGERDSSQSDFFALTAREGADAT